MHIDIARWSAAFREEFEHLRDLRSQYPLVFPRSGSARLQLWELQRWMENTGRYLTGD